ncbi:hypothetical protein Mapa_018561 [Marchantia paleacea]|nr:hypothetical protein Mapa_018561 [Marchantia paleacea]
MSWHGDGNTVSEQNIELLQISRGGAGCLSVTVPSCRTSVGYDFLYTTCQIYASCRILIVCEQLAQRALRCWNSSSVLQKQTESITKIHTNSLSLSILPRASVHLADCRIELSVHISFGERSYCLMNFSVAFAMTLMLASVSMAQASVLFSTLERTLVVEAKIEEHDISTGEALAGVDHLFISWHLNKSFPVPVGDKYVNVKLRLCYAPVSQIDRGWRKTKDDLHKDKTCTKGIAQQKYIFSGNSTTWRITKDVPGAVYFVRAYAVDAEGTQLAFGQTTDKAKTTNLITILPISGRTGNIDIAAAIFSVFSVGSLVGFLGLESIRTKNSK